MIVNSKARDAVKVVLILRDKKKLSGWDMAAELDCSKTHIDGLCFSLRTAGIISSSQGRNGGYQLAKEAKEITFYDIIKATDKRDEDDEANDIQKQVINSFKHITMAKKSEG